jgi:hypothetical protein
MMKLIKGEIKITAAGRRLISFFVSFLFFEIVKMKFRSSYVETVTHQSFSNGDERRRGALGWVNNRRG